MPQPDILGRTATVGEPFSADDTELLFVGASAQSLVVQQLGITYQQNITRLWEIGTDKQYFVSGHQEGGMTMARVVGPKPLVGEFLEQYGDVCNIRENHITLWVKGACATEAGQIKATGCVVTQVAFSINAQDMVINENVNLLVARVEQGQA
jgi:hypothetical protein